MPEELWRRIGSDWCLSLPRCAGIYSRPLGRNGNHRRVVAVHYEGQRPGK